MDFADIVHHYTLQTDLYTLNVIYIRLFFDTPLHNGGDNQVSNFRYMTYISLSSYFQIIKFNFPQSFFCSVFSKWFPCSSDQTF